MLATLSRLRALLGTRHSSEPRAPRGLAAGHPARSQALPGKEPRSLGLCSSGQCRTCRGPRAPGPREAQHRLQRPFRMSRVFPSPMKNLQQQWPSESLSPQGGVAQPLVHLSRPSSPESRLPELFQPQPLAAWLQPFSRRHSAPPSESSRQ